ncbi:SDR family oxidoreductase [Planococcus sp. YIM B11945]|uniref:SDR family oxidoreductase n=1 Tax=Planococcus sp. YIM B11945 TaxID=3435410 RepID=UPI003D7CBE98
MIEIVITGFPGFIASQLIRKIALENMGISAIILPAERQKAEQQATLIQKETGCRPLKLIEGDITKAGLAISSEDIQYIKERTIVFWHLAAIYDLAVPREAAWLVNVEGTKNVNAFVAALPKVERYMYFSTAYVAGAREGQLLEKELIRPERFKNFYEETKFEAEVLVEALKKTVPTTIIRPGIVRGHSTTGQTVKFDGPYFFLNMIDRVRKLPFIPYIGHSTAYINVVPVDYIIEAATYLSGLTEAAGETVHLTDPNPHPVEEVYRAMVFQMTGKTPRKRIPHKLAAWSLSLAMVRKSLGVEAETLDYLTWHASFDTHNAKRLLEKSGIECADFLETIPAMVSFYQLHKKDGKFHVAIQ